MNFWLIIGILMIISSLSFIYHYRINRINRENFKGKYALHLVSGGFFIVGLIFVIIGVVQLSG